MSKQSIVALTAIYNTMMDKVKSVSERAAAYEKAHEGEEGTLLLNETLSILALGTVTVKGSLLSQIISDRETSSADKFRAAAELERLTKLIDETWAEANTEPTPQDTAALDPEEALRIAESLLGAHAEEPTHE